MQAYNLYWAIYRVSIKMSLAGKPLCFCALLTLHKRTRSKHIQEAAQKMGGAH